MTHKTKLLMTPGPTMIPPRVLEKMSMQIIHHRTKEFQSIFEELLADLKYAYDTKNTILVFSSSGTGAMESAIINLFNPKDKVLVVSIGVFGDRFEKIASIYGLDVIKLSVNWGEAASFDKIKEIIDNDTKNEIKAVIMTHNETSTGVTNDIKSVGQFLKNTDKLFVVDAISSLGGLELRTDEWGIDVCVSASQKALMTPPGLSFASVSDKAWEAVKSSTIPKFYFDYIKYKKGQLKEISENPPYTPAISLMVGVSEALKMIREEGIENVYSRHRQLAKFVQSEIKSLRLDLFPNEQVSSYIITAVNAPTGVDIENVRKIMNEKYDVMITGGQAHLKGKIFRIGHCGYVNENDIITTFTALEMALNECGYKKG